MSTVPSAHLALTDPLGGSSPGVRAGRRRLRFLARIVRIALKMLWGMLFMQSFLGSILILGWTNRLIQRRVFRRWWKQRPAPGEEVSFEDYMGGHPDLRIHRVWPNWFIRENPADAVAALPEGEARRPEGLAWMESLKTNFRSGFRTALNTWVVTAAPCALWVFGWYFGWNNSFHKGYELSGIGPATGLAGVVLFIAVMFFLPLAQVRQAVTGEWRSFYEFGFLRNLLRESPVACLFLALLYALFFLPVTVLKTLPGFFPNLNPALIEAGPLEVKAILNRYFFWSALLVFPVFVVLRLAAARIYSSALVLAVRRGSIREASLRGAEKRVLNELGLLRDRSPARSQSPSGFFLENGKAAARAFLAVLTGAVWFSFFALVFIGQFLTYQGSIGWLNQPLVQLPWFRYLPITVRNLWGEVLVSLFFVAALALVAGTWRRVRRLVVSCRPRSADS